MALAGPWRSKKLASIFSVHLTASQCGPREHFYIRQIILYPAFHSPVANNVRDKIGAHGALSSVLCPECALVLGRIPNLERCTA